MLLVKASKELKAKGIIDFEFVSNKDTRVIADYFTDGKTLNEQIRSLSGKVKILIEEVGQVNQGDLYKLYLVKQRYNKTIICSGDPLQVPPPDGAEYDIANNSLILDTLLNGNIVEN